MKKILSLLCPLMLVLVLALSACTDKPEQESQTGSMSAEGSSGTQQAGGTGSDGSDATGLISTSDEDEFTEPGEIVVTIGEGEHVVGN